MSTLTQESAVIQRTRELCQALLDQPEVRDMRKKMETFLADDATRGQYDALVMKGQILQQKQHSGQPLDQAEVDAFESLREGFIKNPVARGFLDAQEDMQKLQQSVTQYVSKTFELGRVPEASDLDSGGCCSDHGGCGCSH